MRRRILWAFTILVVTSMPAPAAPRPHPEPERAQDEAQLDPLAGLGIAVDGETRLLTTIELAGLDQVAEEALWRSIARPVTPCRFSEAARLIRALTDAQTFARIETRLRVARAGEVTLEIRLTEHPRLRDVIVHGLTEVPDAQIVADLLGRTPAGQTDEAPKAPWFAQLDAGVVRPGVLRGGVAGAVRRVVRGLFDAGYRMANASGALSADGVLTIEVDEGQIGAVEIVGPAKSLTRSVEQALELPPGRTFLEADVSEALKRVESALPFLHPEQATRPTRALPLVDVTLDPEGAQRFLVREAPPAEMLTVFAVEGHTLRLFLKARVRVRFGISTDDLLRHTPVGGFGIGARSDVRLWDPKNRIHLRVDSFSGEMDDDARRAVGTDFGEYASALRLRMPALRVADVFLESHAILGTPDGWRMSRSSSHLNSLLFERPDSEYYWRKGESLGITLQPWRQVLLAAEQHTDDYLSLATLQDSSSIFTPGRRFENPPIDEGRIGSAVLRAELFSESVRPEQITSMFRSPDTSIVTRTRGWGSRSGYHVLATLEVARPGLDSDERFRFTRFVGDGTLFLATGAQSGLRLRARLAGGSHLPLQRQEALGGWSALRGFDFKEFRGGDRSLLAMIEYRHVWISGFVDVGSLHRPQAGWSGPHLGAGAKIHFDGLPVFGRWMKDSRLVPPLQLGCAWRLDRRGVARPDLRLLVGQVF